MDLKLQVCKQNEKIQNELKNFTSTEEQDCIGRKSGYSNDYEWFSYNQVSKHFMAY